MGTTSPVVSVFGLRIIRRPTEDQSAPGLIAVFSFEARGFALHEARLFRRTDGVMIAPGPSCESRNGSIRFEDGALHEAITRAACDVARQFGASVDPWPAER